MFQRFTRIYLYINCVTNSLETFTAHQSGVTRTDRIYSLVWKTKNPDKVHENDGTLKIGAIWQQRTLVPDR